MITILQALCKCRGYREEEYQAESSKLCHKINGYSVAVPKIHVRSWASRANLTIDERCYAKILRSFVIFSRKHEYKFLFEIASYRANGDFNFNFNFKALRCDVSPLLSLLKFCVKRRLNQCGSIMRNSSPCIVQTNHETMLKLTLSAATRNPTVMSVRSFVLPPFDN